MGATSAFGRHKAEQSQAGEGQEQKGLEFIRFAEKLLTADAEKHPGSDALTLYRNAENARTESSKINQKIDLDVADKLPAERAEIQEGVVEYLKKKGLSDNNQQALELLVSTPKVGRMLSNKHPQAQIAEIADRKVREAQDALNKKLDQVIEENKNSEVFRQQVVNYKFNQSNEGEAVNFQVEKLDKRDARELLMAALSKMADASTDSKT